MSLVRSACFSLLCVLVLPVVASAQDGPVAVDGLPDRATLSDRLEGMERDLGALREEIGASHARLSILLPDARMSGASRLRIRHRNEMPAGYRLVRASFALDGARIFVRSAPEGGALDRELEIFDGSIPAGEHVLGVELEYRGDGFDVFTYVEGYHFEVRSSHTFHAESGERLDVGIIGYEPGTPVVRVDSAPSVRYVDERASLDD